jgi:PIN domain nuclease of toxin-antitoxin system
MKFLLDTHVLLWSLFESDKLSKSVFKELSNAENEVLISSVSLWEISLKYLIKKIELDVPPERILIMASHVGFTIVSPTAVDISTSHNLPLLEDHKDPFDRMIIWQSIKNDFILVSKDKKFYEYRKYGLNLFW